MTERRKRPTRAELRQKPKEFTPRYHTNETIKPCPACVGSERAELVPECIICGGVGLVYVTGEPSTENDDPEPECEEDDATCDCGWHENRRRALATGGGVTNP